MSNFWGALHWGGDFFSVYVWTDHALVKHDILFFIHLETLRVVIAGITADATEQWLINILKVGLMAFVHWERMQSF